MDLGEVLVADSSIVFRGLVARLMRPHCKRVIEADSVSSAGAICSSEASLTLAIIDAELPDEGGLAILELIAESDAPKPGVVLVGTRIDPEIETRASLLGALGCLRKPLSFHAIAQVMGVSAMRRSTAAPRSYAQSAATALVLDDDASPQVHLDVYDLSESGALLATKGPLPLGTSLSLLLHIDGQPYLARARVIRIQEPNWATLPGVGVVFEGISEEARVQIARQIDRLRDEERRDRPI